MRPGRKIIAKPATNALTTITDDSEQIIPYPPTSAIPSQYSQFSASPYILNYIPTREKPYRIFMFDPQKQVKLLSIQLKTVGYLTDYSSSYANLLDILTVIHPQYYHAMIINMNNIHMAESDLTKSIQVLQQIRNHPQGILPIISLMPDKLEDEKMKMLIERLNVQICKTITDVTIVAAILHKILGINLHTAKPKSIVLETSPNMSSNTSHVLVIDDSIVCLKIFAKILFNHGFKVTTCNNGKHAIELIQFDPSQFDLIVIDVYISEMSAMDVINELDNSNIVIPTIAMSTMDISETAMRDIHAQSFLKKPIKPHELLEAIRYIGVQSIERISRLKRIMGKCRIAPVNKLFTQTQSIHSTQSIEPKIFRALIVDDSIVCLKQLGKILAELGYATDLFFNGNQAYDHLEKYSKFISYDVIITDLHMPIMCGISFIKKIRVLLGDNVPVAVVSAFYDKTTYTLKTGANCFLHKPVTRKQLIDTFSVFSACNLTTPTKTSEIDTPSENRLTLCSDPMTRKPMLCQLTLDMIV